MCSSLLVGWYSLGAGPVGLVSRLGACDGLIWGCGGGGGGCLCLSLSEVCEALIKTAQRLPRLALNSCSSSGVIPLFRAKLGDTSLVKVAPPGGGT